MSYFVYFDNNKQSFKFLKAEEGTTLSFNDNQFCIRKNNHIEQVLINGDDNNCLDLAKFTDCKIFTYAINNKNVDFYADNISFDDNAFPEFDVYKNGKFFIRIKLSIPGPHNILNCLACMGCNFADFDGIYYQYNES